MSRTIWWIEMRRTLIESFTFLFDSDQELVGYKMAQINFMFIFSLKSTGTRAIKGTGS